MRFLRALKTLAGLFAVFFIGLVVTLFVIFPRVVNMLADLLGTGTENPVHWIPALVIDLLLLIVAYFAVWRPWRRFTYAQEAQGLVVYRGQGRAYLDTESVRQQVYSAVTRVPDVQRAEVSINNDLGRAVIILNVLTANGINAPKKKQEISREVKKVVQDQLGIGLAGEPVINLTLAPIVGEVPQVTTVGAVPEVSKSPTSPRTLPHPARTQAAIPPAPAPLPPRIEPITTRPPLETTEPVEIKTDQPVVVTPETPDRAEQDRERNAAEEEAAAPESNKPPESPVVGNRPFLRRPFVPPGGSTTLPDLPEKPAPPPEQQTKSTEEGSATMTNMENADNRE